MTSRTTLREHREAKKWPILRRGSDPAYDARIGPDGYIHQCRADGEPWPCRFDVLRSDLSRAEADNQRLKTLLRECAEAAHDTDSLRDHSKEDVWERAPFADCQSTLCTEARAALADTAQEDRT